MDKTQPVPLTTIDPIYNTPSIPAKDAALVIHASTRVEAPASLVFRTLRNTDTWRDWNTFIPRVTIRWQPPEDDAATDAEIADLIMNTSRLGSIDSDITDGAIGSRAKPKPTPAAATPAAPATSTSPPPEDRSRAASVASGASSGRKHSAAQLFQEGQVNRSMSVASGMSIGSNEGSPSPALKPAKLVDAKLVESASPITGGVLIERSANNRKGSIISPASNRRVSVADATARARSISLTSLYGEPSIRLKLNTTLTLHLRMKLPQRPSEFQDRAVQVTEVSRPDEMPTVAEYQLDGTLGRSTTHTLPKDNKSTVYRIVWGTDHKAEKLGRFILTSQRVHEVRPVIRGDGKEESELRTWECFKGMSAKGLKKDNGTYLQDMAVKWVEGLKAYCEAMGGAVDRRDFMTNP